MRTIDRTVYFTARREGYAPNVAAYAARPAVLDLMLLSHFQVDGEFAEFEYAGRSFRVEILPDPDCLCGEQVAAWRRGDADWAHMTADEYDATDHQRTKVELLDDDGDAIAEEELGSTCSLIRTPTERRLAERFIADTVRDLADDAIRQDEDRRTARAAREAAARAELVEHARKVVSEPGGVTLLADVWQAIGRADQDRRGRVAATFFAILADEAATLTSLTTERIAAVRERADQLTP